LEDEVRIAGNAGFRAVERAEAVVDIDTLAVDVLVRPEVLAAALPVALDADEGVAGRGSAPSRLMRRLRDNDTRVNAGALRRLHCGRKQHVDELLLGARELAWRGRCAMCRINPARDRCG